MGQLIGEFEEAMDALVGGCCLLCTCMQCLGWCRRLHPSFRRICELTGSVTEGGFPLRSFTTAL